MRKLLLIILTLSGCAVKNLETREKIPQNVSNINLSHIAIVMNMNDEQSQAFAKTIELGIKSSGHQNYKIYDIKEEIPSNTKLVLGPLFSDDTISLTCSLRNLNAPIITLSNNPAVVDKNVYVYGHAPMRQTISVLEYTISEGYTKYITFLPNSSFGKNLSAILSHKIKENNLEVVNIHYTSEDTDVHFLKNRVLDILENDDSGRKVVIILGDEKDKIKVLLENIHSLNIDKLSLIIGDSKIKETNSDVSYLYAGQSMNLIAYDLGFLAKKILELHGDLNNVSFTGKYGSFIFKNNIADRNYSIFKCTGNVCDVLFKK